nr:MAG TPA: hypothetical protein [Inoviridae sp.]
MYKSLKYGKRLLALLLVVVMVSGSTYRAHAAAVLPEVVVSGGEALAYLLGILGLTAGGSYVIDNKDDLMSWGNTQIDKLKDWTKTNSDKVNTWGAATSQEIESTIDAWIDKAAKGVIDTGSAVWDSLKAWGASIYEGLTSGSSGSEYEYLGGGVRVDNKTFTCGGNYQSQNNVYTSCDAPGYVAIFVTGTKYNVYMYAKTETKPVGGYLGYYGSETVVDGKTYYFAGFSAGYSGTFSASIPYYPWPSGFATNAAIPLKYILGMSVDIPADEYISVGGVSDIFDRDKTLDNIGVLVPGITAGATDIPIDWGLVGDIAGTLTDVRAGTLDIADVLADAKVFPIDKTRDTVIDSDGDLSNDKAATDVIPAVPDAALSDYTLAGLEKVFPFCIPFDLMSFLGVLAADPKAPAFDWPITYPTLSGSATYTLHIDLSDFDPVAKIVRDMECLGFILGLIMITRDKMIMG